MIVVEALVFWEDPFNDIIVIVIFDIIVATVHNTLITAPIIT